MIFNKNKKQYCIPMVGHRVADATIDVYHEEEFKKIRLSDLKGRWVVLFFYPADFTFVCPTELFELSEMYQQFQKANVEIISISTDSLATHKDWKSKSKQISSISYPMGSDVDGQLAKKLGVYSEHDHFCYRATIIIDPAGFIRAYDVNSIEIGRSVSELFRKIQALEHVRIHPDELCPASWKPGQKTLMPKIKK
jgi:NADH-dependent peroxiredoxin subunit C